MKRRFDGTETDTRREFLRKSALICGPILATRLGGDNRAHAKDDSGAGPRYQPVEDWPDKTFPEVMCRGIDADRQGRLYIAGDEERPILKLTTAGKFLGVWGSGVLVAPHGVRVQGKTVWVSDIKTHQVHQFTLDGKLVRSFGEKGVAGDGPEQFDKPTDFAFGPDGSIYISDGYGNTRVVCLAPDGTVRNIWGQKGDGDGEFNLVHAVAIDRSRRVLVADRNNSRIQLFDLDGNHVATWNNVGKPYGLFAVADGSIFMCGLAPDGERFRVQKLDSSGKVIAAFGSTGDGPGQFLMAHSIFVDKANNVYVADGKASRVQKFVLR